MEKIKIFYEDKISTDIFEPDNTTAMNCKWYGKPKFLHSYLTINIS